MRCRARRMPPPRAPRVPARSARAARGRPRAPRPRRRGRSVPPGPDRCSATWSTLSWTVCGGCRHRTRYRFARRSSALADVPTRTPVRGERYCSPS
ncbi:hypothetical protein FK523_07635 [Curtobacterium flaccumfaciens pv. flaccumfaciens]|nr:hypothetical protein FK523_07635 [Curtobacterium flaccumfaciens pv. flaccumfaciens]